MSRSTDRHPRECSPARLWRRWLPRVGAIAAIVVAIVLQEARRARLEWRHARAFPLQFLQDAPTLAGENRNSPTPRTPTPRIDIRSVSDDGRWVFLGLEGGSPGNAFFDVTERRFVAAPGIRATGTPNILVTPLLYGGWTPDRMFFLTIMGERTDVNLPLLNDIWPFRWGWETYSGRAWCFAANALTAQSRFLFRDELYDEHPGPYLPPAPNATVMAYRYEPRPDSMESSVFVLRNLQTGERKDLPRSEFQSQPGNWVWLEDWLPGSQTLVLQEVGLGDDPYFGDTIWPENLYLVPVDDPEDRRRVPVRCRFDALRAAKRLAPDEDTIHNASTLGFVGGGRRIRLLVTFQSGSVRKDPSKDRSSLWDLDLKTGELARVLDLTDAPVRSRFPVASPSGDRLITVHHDSRETSPGLYLPRDLVLYSVGQRPRRLPFQVEVWGSQSAAWNLDTHVQFLDDHSLVYVRAPYELWKFDLRTWKSELLWRPGSLQTSQP